MTPSAQSPLRQLLRLPLQAALGLDVDLPVVSACEGDVEPIEGTLLGRLDQAYGIHLGRLGWALELRSGC